MEGSMAKRFNVSKAGELVQLSYSGRLGPRVKASLDRGGVQAYFLNDGTLVIPGSNEFQDYTDFNLRLRRVLHTDKRKYHGGFLTHAKAVLAWLDEKNLHPTRITGHSLGAASAQIVGSHLAKPTVAFASPKVLQGSDRLNGEGWVANFQRVDDPICNLPLGDENFRHIGSRLWMASPVDEGGGLKHKVKYYLALINDKNSNTKIPRVWPR
tara:strand:- start:612 stop:1244 length:633 start_codon:yes stop_codon:yes gene_type:complete